MALHAAECGASAAVGAHGIDGVQGAIVAWQCDRWWVDASAQTQLYVLWLGVGVEMTGVVVQV